MSISPYIGGYLPSPYGFNWQSALSPYSTGVSPWASPFIGFGSGYNPMLSLSPWANNSTLWGGNNWSNPTSSLMGFNNAAGLSTGSSAMMQMLTMLMMQQFSQLNQPQTAINNNGVVRTTAPVVANNTATAVNNNGVVRTTAPVVANNTTTAVNRPNTVVNGTPAATTQPTNTNAAPIADKTVIKGGTVILGIDLLTKVAQNPNQAVTLVRQELERLAGSKENWKIANLFRPGNPTTHKHGGKEDKPVNAMIARLAQAAIDQSKDINLPAQAQTTTVTPPTNVAFGR